MRNCRKTGKTGKKKVLARFRAWAPLALCLVLAGCSTTRPHAKGDPLVGEIHPGPGGANVPAPPNPPSHTKSAVVPPVPSTQGPTTNAALASMEGSRSLAIGSNTSAATQPKTFTPASGASPVIPNPPVASAGGPKVVPLPREAIPPAVLTTGSVAANQQANDILQAQLKLRGVSFQKQDPAPEGIRFTCIVPDPGDPSRNNFYEATARDYPTAVQAVLLQIDQKK